VRNAAIGKAIRKYGEHSFSIKILKRIGDHEDALRWEKHFIGKYLSYMRRFGYNRNQGGIGILWHTDATRAKMSRVHLGKIHTDEYKAYMSRVISNYRRSSGRVWTRSWLTDNDVRDIRRLAAEMKYKRGYRLILAARYHTAPRAIGDLVRGATFSHVSAF
jgi:hypothetical protein